MRALNKKVLITLSLTISTAAVAEIQHIDDAMLAGITGQSGITIEIDTKIHIGEVIYTDTASGALGDIGGGGISAQNISIQGANKTSFFGSNIWGVVPSDRLNNIKVTVDLNTGGDLVINMGPAEYFGVIAFQVGMEKVQLLGTSAPSTLLSDLSIVGLAGAGSVIVGADDNVINIVTSLAIDDLDVNADFLSLGLKDVQVTGASFDIDAPQQLRAFFELDFKVYNAITAQRDALAIDVNKLEIDVRIGAIELAGNSIGSVFIDDLNISNVHLEIYGH